MTWKLTIQGHVPGRTLLPPTIRRRVWVPAMGRLPQTPLESKTQIAIYRRSEPLHIYHHPPQFAPNTGQSPPLGHLGKRGMKLDMPSCTSGCLPNAHRSQAFKTEGTFSSPGATLSSEGHISVVGGARGKCRQSNGCKIDFCTVRHSDPSLFFIQASKRHYQLPGTLKEVAE